jgi:hypothetical protein
MTWIFGCFCYVKVHYANVGWYFWFSLAYVLRMKVFQHLCMYVLYIFTLLYAKWGTCCSKYYSTIACGFITLYSVKDVIFFFPWLSEKGMLVRAAGLKEMSTSREVCLTFECGLAWLACNLQDIRVACKCSECVRMCSYAHARSTVFLEQCLSFQYEGLRWRGCRKRRTEFGFVFVFSMQYALGWMFLCITFVWCMTRIANYVHVCWSVWTIQIVCMCLWERFVRSCAAFVCVCVCLCVNHWRWDVL